MQTKLVYNIFMKQTPLTILSRGVEQILPNKDTLLALMNTRKIKLYLGIDPTGSLLTLGHAVVLRKLQQFAELGHDVILLVGSGTVKIGDPTGKDTTRPELSDREIRDNFKNWQAQASKVLNFDQIKVKYNGDWLDQLRLPDFIKLMAKTTVQQLIERDMFQNRLKNNLPIFTHELMYPLLQGYDSVAMDVDLEIGGSDQLFNMLMGKHLLKVYKNKPKWVLTTPIINGLDGRKMSKSYNNYVALTEQPNQMYGKLMSLSDDQIIPYLTLLTDTLVTDLEEIKQSMVHGQNPMQYKKLLAFEITKWLHSDKLATQAQEEFELVVQQKQLPNEIQDVSADLAENPELLSLVWWCLPSESISQHKRLISQGAVELMESKYKPTNYQEKIKLVDGMIVRIGKRQYFRIKKK